jgi:hypothetical protein
MAHQVTNWKYFEPLWRALARSLFGKTSILGGFVKQIAEDRANFVNSR